MACARQGDEAVARARQKDEAVARSRQGDEAMGPLTKPPAYHHDHCPNKNYWLKSWTSDHPERYLAAQAPTIVAGGSATSWRFGVFTFGDQVRDSTDACGRLPTTSS